MQSGGRTTAIFRYLFRTVKVPDVKEVARSVNQWCIRLMVDSLMPCSEGTLKHCCNHLSSIPFIRNKYVRQFVMDSSTTIALEPSNPVNTDLSIRKSDLSISGTSDLERLETDWTSGLF